MSDSIMSNYNKLRTNLVTKDRRFSAQNGKLCFDGVNLEELAKKYPTPFYVFSEKEIDRNVQEIKGAFKAHPNTKIFYASKTCSVMGVLKAIKDAGIYAEANSMFEVRKCLEIGFSGSQIVFNGVVKKPVDLEFAIQNDLYIINVDSLYELDIIDEISTRLKKVANVCVRVEPNVPSATHAELVTAYHAKSGIDLEQAEETCRRILDMPYVHLRGLHMHVGDQVPEAEPFAKATKVLVDESRRLEEVLGIKFDLINVGGGIPVPYKYDEENGNPLQDNMYAGITAQDFADAVISEVHKWRTDVEICIEPGRKVTGSAGVLVTEVACEKRKTNYDLDGNIEEHVEWKFVDAGYSVLSDSQHFDWFFYVYNASKINEAHDEYIKLAGPLCDGGDYYHIGVKGEEFLMPKDTQVGDIVAFLDAGAYTIESQTVYNNRPRTSVVMIDKDGKDRLIRREDTYEDMVGYDIY
ncbi:diaminopimelate decarboxylase [Gilliamella sp. Nev5-1]|uniref:diaminopimelate decarboxylase n=1 Tax=unclassified Gilliamella TaxID=2685620 RepID=UPI00080EDB85|nr:diaminopimelate decarboxylase [Gilliamella apicola]OCG59457.1 diaminopimelate decarboxylase [Gilliamella apicola]OCG66489.1 diaminopimelate decarboxylase [Gilliamella apicola]